MLTLYTTSSCCESAMIIYRQATYKLVISNRSNSNSSNSNQLNAAGTSSSDVTTG